MATLTVILKRLSTIVICVGTLVSQSELLFGEQKLGPHVAPALTHLDQNVRVHLDADFDNAIGQIANSVSRPYKTYDAGPIFRPLIDKYSVEVLHDYINARFGLEREREPNLTRAAGARNFDIVLWSDQNPPNFNELTTINPKFNSHDRLVLAFEFTDDWRSITTFEAKLDYIPTEF